MATSDIFIRAAGEEFQKRTGQRLVVENRSGGAMNIGAEACANGSNDGYTICILPNESLALNEYLYKELPYNPETAFVPITNPFFNPQVIVASAALKVRSMAELAAASKATPGKLSYSALSVPMQMFIEEWKKKTGADLVQVPARGGGEVATGVMTGTVPVAIVGVPNWLPYIRNGSAVPLAVNTTERLPLLPDVPTLKELGYADAAQMYFGIVAPAKTPASAVQKLYGEFKAIGDELRFPQTASDRTGPGSGLQFAERLSIKPDGGTRNGETAVRGIRHGEALTFSAGGHKERTPPERRPHQRHPAAYMPALISVCSVAALAASFCCSAACIDAFRAFSSFICWMACTSASTEA